LHYRKVCEIGPEVCDPLLLESAVDSIGKLLMKRKPRQKKESGFSLNTNQPRSDLLGYLKSLWERLPEAIKYNHAPHAYSLSDEGYSYDDLKSKIADSVVKNVFFRRRNLDIDEGEAIIALPSMQGKSSKFEYNALLICYFLNL
jgi:hypothetical protein